jgi:hypothetical protein
VRSHDLIRLLNKPVPCAVSSRPENISFEVTRHDAIAIFRVAGGCFAWDARAGKAGFWASTCRF